MRRVDISLICGRVRRSYSLHSHNSLAKSCKGFFEFLIFFFSGIYQNFVKKLILKQFKFPLISRLVIVNPYGLITTEYEITIGYFSQTRKIPKDWKRTERKSSLSINDVPRVIERARIREMVVTLFVIAPFTLSGKVQGWSFFKVVWLVLR